MPEFEIKIKTTAELTALEKATDATNKLSAAQEKLSNTGKGLASAPSDVRDSFSGAPLTREDVGAIEKSIAALERKIAIYKALGESTAEYEAALAKLNTVLRSEEAATIKAAVASEGKALADQAAAVAAAELAAANQAAAIGLDGLASMARKLNPLLQDVSTQSGAAGGALSLLFNPGVIGAAFAAQLIYHAVIKEIEELNKVLEESAEAGNKQAQWQHAVKEGLRNIAIEADTFERRLSRVGRVEDEVRYRTEALTHALERQDAAQRTAATSARELEEAKIHALEQAGKITHEKALVFKLELDTKFFEQQLDFELKKAQALLKLHHKQFLDEQNRLPGLKKDVVSTRSTLAGKESTKTKFEDDAKRAQEAIDASQRIINKT